MTTAATHSKPRRAAHFVSRLGRYRYSIGAVVAFFVGWELVVRLGNVQPFILPEFSDVLAASWTHSDLLLSQAWVTAREVIYGFLLSVVVGVTVGVAIVTFRPVSRGIYPLLVSSQVVPKIAIAPLLLVWFGFGTLPKVLISFLLGFFPIVVDTVLGLRSLDIEKIYFARTTGAGWSKTFFKVRLPNALPTMFTGFKIAATLCVTGAVVGEFVSPGDGLGRTIVIAASELRTDLLFAGVIYISLLGLLAFSLISVLERLVVGWHVSQRREPMRSGG